VFVKDGYTDLLVARLFDFFHRRSPWQRRLWRTGLVLELREVVEYSRVLEASAATTEHGINAPVAQRWVTRHHDGTWSTFLDPGVPAA
jgi:hypothetical protein